MLIMINCFSQPALGDNISCIFAVKRVNFFDCVILRLTPNKKNGIGDSYKFPRWQVCQLCNCIDKIFPLNLNVTL